MTSNNVYGSDFPDSSFRSNALVFGLVAAALTNQVVVTENVIGQNVTQYDQHASYDLWGEISTNNGDGFNLAVSGELSTELELAELLKGFADSQKTLDQDVQELLAEKSWDMLVSV